MAGANPNILLDSVRFILSNWTALQLAVEHGFGGADGREKAEWLVSVVDQVLRENGQYHLLVCFENSASLNLNLLTRARFDWNHF